VFKRIFPGRIPEIPDRMRFDDFIEIMEQTLDVCTRAANEVNFIHPQGQSEDMYLIREKGEGENAAWQDKYRKLSLKSTPIRITNVSRDLEALQELPLARTVLQAHFQILPFPVKAERDLTVFLFILVMVNKHTKKTEVQQLITPLPTFNDMMTKLPNIMLSSIRSLGFRPRSIEVKNQLMFKMLSATIQSCEVHVVIKDSLPLVDEAVEKVIEEVTRSSQAV
jgi:hypothetical protein